jgi:outer membrane protein OmpA-like peptidoglycan-associated protein
MPRLSCSRRPAVLAIAAAAAAPCLVPAAPALAQQPSAERATGTVTIERPPPEPRGFVVEQGGRPVTGVVPRGGAVDVTGAGVVVVDETPRGTRLTVQNDVLFDFDRAALRPEAAEALGRVKEMIERRRPRAVRVVGHTDAIGSEAYNDDLSLRRARSVERWLDSHGTVPPIAVEGRGEREPVAPNAVEGRDNPEGRQKNRRVEIFLEG